MPNHHPPKIAAHDAGKLPNTWQALKSATQAQEQTHLDLKNAQLKYQIKSEAVETLEGRLAAADFKHPGDKEEVEQV